MQNTTPGKIKIADLPQIPCPALDNDSGLDALLFNTIDQRHQVFHVLVAKSAWLISPGADGAQLIEDHMSPELLGSDLAFDDDAAQGWRQESDLLPYKPVCDILLDAEAIAPGQQALPQFGVRIQVQAGPESAEAGNFLVDKQLLITGPRWFEGSGKDWRLSAPQAISRLPLRHTYALGGSLRLRLRDGDALLRAAPAAELLATADEQGHRLHQLAESNPLGLGFARAWHLQASEVVRWPAPQISYLNQPYDAAAFWRAAQGETLPPSAAPCVIGKAWSPRRQLAGMLPPQTYAADEIPFLPAEFDYRYWNCAPSDQQCRYLQPGDILRLINLCEPGNPASSVDAHGNRILQCALPIARCIVLISQQQGGQAMLDVQELQLDTLVYKQAENRLECTWRICLVANPAILGLRLLYLSDAAQLERLRTLQTAQAALAHTSLTHDFAQQGN